MTHPHLVNHCHTSGSVSRRDLLKLAGGAVASAAMTPSAVHTPQPARSGGKGYDFRLLLGWINDICHRPLVGKRWPITDVDERTVEEYKQFLRIAWDYGYNGMTIWGLYVSHAWPVPLKKALVPQRRRIIDQILIEADKVGIKILHGLGVYSWSFEEIIKHDPTTARNEGRRAWGGFQPDNGVAMCYHSESARQWMRDIVDLIVQEMGTQGFGFQSGDLGRCFCRECKTLSDTEFHSRVIDETAQYVRQKYPDQILGMSAWGVDLGCGANALQKMIRHLDYLTDVTDQSKRLGSEYRRTLTAGLPCALGSLGGAVVVPPQRWKRDRWFFPHARLTDDAIRSLSADGGRAFEYFVGPLNNPGYNLMTRYTGLLLQDASLSNEQVLLQVVRDLYAPKNSSAADNLVHWLLKVEKAYTSRVGDIMTGELDFEPLKNETAGESIYLLRLSDKALDAYDRDLAHLAGKLHILTEQCRQPDELHLIGRCLDNVRQDVRYARKKKQASS